MAIADLSYGYTIDSPDAQRVLLVDRGGRRLLLGIWFALGLMALLGVQGLYWVGVALARPVFPNGALIPAVLFLAGAIGMAIRAQLLWRRYHPLMHRPLAELSVDWTIDVRRRRLEGPGGLQVPARALRFDQEPAARGLLWRLEMRWDHQGASGSRTIWLGHSRSAAEGAARRLQVMLGLVGRPTG